MNTNFFLPKKGLGIALLGLAALPGFTQKTATKATRPNILFIAVDDLKPWVSAYGDKHAKTPGMDKLAKEGIVFTSSYCQQAICAATRASIMTGMRPDRTRVWDLVTDLRQVNPNVQACIKGDSKTGYPVVKKVLKIMQDYKVNRFNLITSLEATKINLAEIQK